MGESIKLPTWRIQKNYKRIRGGARLIRAENIKQCQKSSVKVTKSGYNVKPLFKNRKPIKLCTSFEKTLELQLEILLVPEKLELQNSSVCYSNSSPISTPEKPITPITPLNDCHFHKADDIESAQPTLSDYDSFFYGVNFLIEDQELIFNSFNSLATPTEVDSFSNQAAPAMTETYVPTIQMGSSGSYNEFENLTINPPLYLNN